MVDVVRRRFLVSYAVEPSLLSAMVPPSAELSTHNGFAWVSACFVELVDMRPSIVPKGLGSRFYYLGSSGFLVDVRPTPAPSCSFCGTGIDHCAL